MTVARWPWSWDCGANSWAVRDLLWRLVERWHALVHSRQHPTILATNQLQGWFGRFQPRAHLARRLKTEMEALNFLCPMAHGMA